MDIGIGLSLINFQVSSQPQLAHDAEQTLGNYIDDFCLGMSVSFNSASLLSFNKGLSTFH